MTERESALGLEFEEALMALCLNERNQNSKKSRKPVVKFESCCHELWNIGIRSAAKVTEYFAPESAKSQFGCDTLGNSAEDLLKEKEKKLLKMLFLCESDCNVI